MMEISAVFIGLTGISEVLNAAQSNNTDTLKLNV